MSVRVVKIRRMRVAVRLGLVTMPMAMQPCGHGGMVMGVMPIVMCVGMLVFQGFVSVFMAVGFHEMQTHARQHQESADTHTP